MHGKNKMNKKLNDFLGAAAKKHFGKRTSQPDSKQKKRSKTVNRNIFFRQEQAKFPLIVHLDPPAPTGSTHQAVTVRDDVFMQQLLCL